jgi:hypothetical protein
LAIKYNSDGFPVFVPDDEGVPAVPDSPGFWESYGRPTLSAIGDIASLPMKGGGLLAGLATDALGGRPSVRLNPGTGLWDDITGRSTIAPTLPQWVIQRAKVGAITAAPSLEDVIGERLDVSQASGLSEQSPEEILRWQASHPIAAYTKAIAEPVAELGLGIALDPTLGAMRVLGAASKAPALLKAAEAASRAGRTLEAAESAAKAAAALRASRTMRAIVSGESEIGSMLAARPGVAPIAERVLGAAYVPSMATGFIEGIKQTARQYKDSGLSPDVVRSGLEAGASGVFAGLGLKHALTPQVAGPRTTGLSPERLDTALRGADLAQDVVGARAAAEVAPQPEIAPIPAAPAPVVEAPPARVEPPVAATEVARPAAPEVRPVEKPLDVALLRDDIGEYGERTYDPELIRRFEAGREGFSDAEVASYAPEGATPQDLAAIRLDHSLKFEALRRGKEWLDTLNERHPGEGTAIETVPIGSGGLAGHDVLQRVNGKIVGAGEGFAGYRQQMAGGKVYSSPASMRPVYETMDSLGYLPSDVLSPFGRKAQRKYAERQRSAGPVLPDAVLDSAHLAPGGGGPQYPSGVQDAVGGEPGQRGQAVPQVGAVPTEAPRVEPIIAQTRREAYQALRSKYGDTPPDVKTMVDRHGVKIEWANDIRKRWGNSTWENVHDAERSDPGHLKADAVAKSYSESSYTRINKALREGREQDVEGEARAMDRFVEAGRQKFDALYRGSPIPQYAFDSIRTVSDALEWARREYPPGTIMRDRGFRSTSLGKDEALPFSYENIGLVLKIRGAEGARMEGVSDVDSAEREVVMPRGVPLRVASVEGPMTTDFGKPYIELVVDALPPERAYTGEITNTPGKVAYSVPDEKPRFISRLREVLDEPRFPTAASGADYLRYLSDPKRGVKRAELESTAVSDFLKENSDKRVTREQLASVVERNDISGRIGAETRTKDQLRWSEEKGALVQSGPQYGKYSLPGGTNYREELIRDPESEYRSTHFRDAPGLLAHLRTTDRIDSSGKKTLFLEEIQSDYARESRSKLVSSGERARLEAEAERLEQEWEDISETRPESDPVREAAWRRWADARQEYEAAAVLADRPRPTPHPLVEKAEDWVGLGFKRAMQMAVEGGYDKIAWTRGEQQIARYGGGDKLKKAGVWMGDLYDKIVPQVARKLTYKYGSGYNDMDASVLNKGGPVHSLDVTPKMVEAVRAGLPVFKAERGADRPAFFSITEDAPRVQAGLGRNWKVEPVGEGDAARWKLTPEGAPGVAIHVGLDGHIEIDPAAYAQNYGRSLSAEQAKLGATGQTVIRKDIPFESTITLAKGRAGVETLHHEIFHVAALTALGPDGAAKMEKRFGGPGWQERAARAYEKWAPSHPDTLFTPIYDFFRNVWQTFTGARDEADAIFRSVQTGKVFKQMGGRALTAPAAREAIARELAVLPDPTKKQVAMALARDLGVEDIVRHEAGADAFLFDATSLLRGSVRDVTRINPIGTAFLRDVVDPKTNYGTYAPALEKARAMFGDDLQKKYEEWVNTRQLPSVGAAFERIRGDVKTRRTIGVGIEHAVRADLESIVPDLKQTLGISGVGEQVGAGAFANVFDLGPDSEGNRRVARVSALPGDNARPRMVSEFIAPEIGRQFTADKREVTIQPYTYSKEEVGKNQQRFNQDVARLTAGLEAQGFKDLDIHDSNVRYLDKEGTKPVVVDLGSVQPKDSKVPAAEWIANKVDEYAEYPPQGLDPGEYNTIGGPGVGRSPSDVDPGSIRGKFGTFSERLRFMFADKLYYMKKAEAATYKNLGKGSVVPKSESGASALEVMPSRAMDRIKNVVEVAIDEIDALMAKNNATMDDVGAVLVAEHAPVRNRAGMERKTKVENAMGVSDAEASKVKDDMMADGSWERAMPAANRFRDLMRTQVDLMEEYHLATPERLAALRSPEWRDTYAPAKHEDPLNPWESSSGGGGVRNPLKRFAGRATPPDNPLGFGFSQAAETIAKGEHNLGWNKFADFIRENPDENWKVLDKPKTHETTGEVGGELKVVSVPDKGWMDKHTIAFLDRAGMEKFIQIDDPRVMESLKRSGPDTTGEVLGYIGKGMRVYSGLLTRWNPEFLIPNLLRDAQMALASIGVEKSARVVKQVTKGIIPAMRATWKVLRDPTSSGEWEDIYKAYSKAGGPMNVLQLKNGPEYLKEAGRGLERLTKPSQFKEVFRKSIQVLDDLNAAVETGVRLSYFKALREAGMSEEASIHASKDLTVNFDRRGALGPAMNSLYLFFNASVQGGMRTAQVLNSPRGRKAALAMMVAGYALDQAQAASDKDSNGDGISDWDSIPEYVKERNLIIGNATIPMPYGFNTIVNAGRLASAVMRGQMSPAKAAGNGALSFFSTFNPFGGAEDFTQMVTPSFLEPFVQSATNKNFAGNAIVPDQPKWGAKKPDSERFWRTTSPVAKWLAQTGNTLTGGDKLSAGFVDISPNTIEHWSNFALGGWSRILSGGQAVAETVAKGEPIPISKIPVIRRQYYEEHPADVGRMWRATQEEMEQLKARAEMYQKDRQFDRLRKIPRPLLGMADYLARVEREAQDVQKAARSGSISEKAAQERVKQLQIRSLLNVTKARQRAEAMGFSGGYAASPGSGI